MLIDFEMYLVISLNNMKTKTNSITTLGLTGSEWITRLEKKYKLSDYAKQVLNSPSFKLTKKSYDIVIFTIKDIGDKLYYTTKEIEDYAFSKGYERLPVDAACVIREKFTDKDIEKLGLWYIVTMHESIEAYGGPHFLRADRDGGGGWLRTPWAYPGSFWYDFGAFAWSLPQGTKSLKLSTKALGTLDLSKISVEIKIGKDTFTGNLKRR